MKILLILLLPFYLCGQSTLTPTNPQNLKFAKTIQLDDIKRHVLILASDSLKGRETGKRGQKMAANYIVDYFKSIGIPPYKKNLYCQKFKVKTVKRYGKWKQPSVLEKLFKKDYIKGENIIGFIEGGDLKDEIIVITAHYDHLGTKKDTLIYNGADDNASGTAAIMEIAQAFMLAKKEGNGPRRSVLIMPVSGEEKGLLGSKYYTENPIYPLENTIANLNVDMIGRTDKKYANDPNYIYLIGSDRLSMDLHHISEEVNNKYINLRLDYTYNEKDDPNRYYYRSDHYNFAKNNIPVIFYFNGVHKDYHQPTDTAEKINFEKIEKISRYIFLTAWELANRDERPKLD